MVRKHFLMSHSICDIRLKSGNPDEIHALGYWSYVVGQYGRLPTSGQALYLKINLNFSNENAIFIFSDFI